MRIGIISDTHDNLDKIEAAVELFNKEKTDLVIHCGDYIAPFSLKPLFGLNCDWAGVFGNCDGEKDGLRKKSDGKIKDAPLTLKFDNKKIIVVHSIQDYNRQNSDIVLFGHTHNPEIIRGEHALFINPGEASGWITGDSTVAILDTISLKVEIKDIQ